MSLANKVSKKIRDSLELARHQKFEGSLGLIPEAYTDPDYFEVEKEVLFKKQWQCIARVEQLEKTGDYIALTVSDVPIILSKTKSGEIKALANVCQHRSATLVEEGNGNKRKFSCPYHAWTYELSGELFSLPLEEGFHNFDKSKCKLPEFRLEIWEGFIFINISGDAEPLAPQLENAKKAFAPWGLSEMKVVHSFWRRDLPWNWKVFTENAAEIYHIMCAHKNTLEVAIATRSAFVKVKDKGMTSLGGLVSKEVQDMFDLSLIPDLEVASEGHANLVYPYLIFAVFPTNTTWVRIVPKSVNSIDLEFITLQPHYMANDSLTSQAELESWGSLWQKFRMKMK